MVNHDERKVEAHEKNVSGNIIPQVDFYDSRHDWRTKARMSSTLTAGLSSDRNGVGSFRWVNEQPCNVGDLPICSRGTRTIS